MSNTAVFWLAVYGGGLAGSILHPTYPLVAYLTFYYMPPHLNWWGQDLPELRYSLIAALFLLASVVILQSGLEKLKDERNPALRWLMAWGANTVLVTAWALDSARSWLYTVVCLKLVLLYALLPGAIRTPTQFDLFGAVHLAGTAYWGYKAWDNPKREAGRLMEVGGPDTQNDNQAAGHMLTVLPFAALYVLTERRKLLRALYVVEAGFIVNVFILCNSRGATLGLIVAGMAAIYLAGKGRRKRLIGVGILGALALLYLADPEFIARQQTTMDPTDNSAQSRKVFWAAGLRMVKDYPLGGGGRTFHLLSPRYVSNIRWDSRTGERSPHNTFIQLATDWGVQGTVFFSAFVFATLRLLHRIRRRTPENSWYFYRSLTVEVALIGTLTAGFFSNRLYGESIYWMCALAYALHRIQATELAAVQTVADVNGVTPSPVLARAAIGRQLEPGV